MLVRSWLQVQLYIYVSGWCNNSVCDVTCTELPNMRIWVSLAWFLPSLFAGARLGGYQCYVQLWRNRMQKLNFAMFWLRASTHAQARSVSLHVYTKAVESTKFCRAQHNCYVSILCSVMPSTINKLRYTFVMDNLWSRSKSKGLAT